MLFRWVGECLITLATRPDISKEILANNGIVLTFKNHIEKEIICELLNIDLEKKYYLSKLEEGECIIRVNSIKEPFLLKIPLIKRKFLTVSEVTRNNNKILNSIKSITAYHLNEDRSELKESDKKQKGKSTNFLHKLKKLKKITYENIILEKLYQNEKNKNLNNQIEIKKEIDKVDIERKEFIEYISSLINNEDKNE